jgi:hypothetical protein
MQLGRRSFLATPALIAELGQRDRSRLNAADDPLTRRFFMDLSCGRIGLKATFLESMDLAVRHDLKASIPMPSISDCRICNWATRSRR